MDILAIFAIILLANIIQGITGFAGTLIAMPFLIMIVDLETAKQSLNFLGILASLWIISKDYRYINWKYFKKILFVMLLGLIIGMASYNILPKDLLMMILPLFVFFVGLKGIFSSLTRMEKIKKENALLDNALLLSAGIIHGLFVAGGPLLVTYATSKLDGKSEFRVTLSSIWLVSNTIMMIQSIVTGVITKEMAGYMGIAIVPLFFGILIGSILLKRMSQKTFMLISYSLLIFSGISLLM